MGGTTRIHLWSGPRNLSTAMMYSFAQRSDTRVEDEPLYAHYLLASGVMHPGRDEVLAAQEGDALKVIDRILGAAPGRPVAFFKQMTHHLEGIPETVQDRLLSYSGTGGDRTLNIVLIRDPADVLRSYAKVIEAPSLRDIGIRQSYDLFHRLKEKGFHCVVLDAADLLGAPRATLMALCGQLDLPFEESMLHWSAGPRPEDGVWAKHWYGRVHRTTGFEGARGSQDALPDTLEAIAVAARPYYEYLGGVAIRAA